MIALWNLPTVSRISFDASLGGGGGGGSVVNTNLWDRGVDSVRRLD